MPHSLPPVRLAPVQSRGLRQLLYAAHGVAALLAILACGIEATGLLLVGALGLHLLQILETLRRQDAELGAAVFDSAGAWRLQWRDGTADSANLLPSPIVASWLCCIRLRSHAGRGVVTLLLTPDNIDATSFRRLRMRLLWARAGRSGARASESAALAPRQP
jgi:hypothetical protein